MFQKLNNKISFFFVEHLDYLKSLRILFLPNYCPSCNKILRSKDAVICPKCLLSLSRVSLASLSESVTAEALYGRVRFEYATSFCYFIPNNPIQKLIHALKYKGMPNIGIEMGKLFGFELQETSMLEVDYIIPVPLHEKKLIKRGYNQAEKIAQGLSVPLNAIVDLKALSRKRHHRSQTKLDRYERWKNVENIFQLNNPTQFNNKHVLLVDDVLTTGATLEALASVFDEVENIKISIVTLAVVSN